jgi:hypothetical protein
MVREWLVLQGSGHDYQSRPDPIPKARGSKYEKSRAEAACLRPW